MEAVFYLCLSDEPVVFSGQSSVQRRRETDRFASPGCVRRLERREGNAAPIRWAAHGTCEYNFC
jgi:hypothetical protein